MRTTLSLLVLIVFIVLGSCRKDFTPVLNTGVLEFSKDTVYLDTVFTGISSSTYRLKVYNKSAKDIFIPTVTLDKGNNSFYRLNVDGAPGKSFENVEILAKDSLYIFIETTIDFEEVADPLYTDAIVFNNGISEQQVQLISLVQDAHFLFPSKNANGTINNITIGSDDLGEPIQVNGFYLTDETVFSDDKPYVIYGYCAVPENGILTIEAGSDIHFHKNSGIIIEKNATLNINGTQDNEVHLEGDRLEPEFENTPGQWGSIWFQEGSQNNHINYAIIKNASTAIIVDAPSVENTPVLNIKNTQIYNSSEFGLLGQNSNISGENLIINSSGKSSLACTYGGTYQFIHCTFTNFWSNNLRRYPAVLIHNYPSGDNTVPNDLWAATFINCIIDGNNHIEISLEKEPGSIFNYEFKNNLIKFNDPNNSYAGIDTYNFQDGMHYSNNLINAFPDFRSPENNDLRIGQNSDLIQKGSTDGSLLVPIDIKGMLRANPGDIGAHEHVTFE